MKDKILLLFEKINIILSSESISTMSNLFMKTFDPLIMSGFKNRKELENYWLFSQISAVMVSCGMLTMLVDYAMNMKEPGMLSIAHIFGLSDIFGHSMSLTTTSIIFLIYLFLFALVFSVPFIVNWCFVHILPKSLPYWYVHYMWVNSKNAILVVMQDLPPDILNAHERHQLQADVSDLNINTGVRNTNGHHKAQIKLLIKVWHKNFHKEIGKELRHK